MTGLKVFRELETIKHGRAADRNSRNDNYKSLMDGFNDRVMQVKKELGKWKVSQKKHSGLQRRRYEKWLRQCVERVQGTKPEVTCSHSLVPVGRRWKGTRDVAESLPLKDAHLQVWVSVSDRCTESKEIPQIHNETVEDTLKINRSGGGDCLLKWPWATARDQRWKAQSKEVTAVCWGAVATWVHRFHRNRTVFFRKRKF